MKIVGISPHPDDIEYGAGGILVNLSKLGYDITLLVNEKFDKVNLHTEEKILLRKQDTYNAAKHISANVQFFNVDNDLNSLANIFRLLKPDIVFMPSCYETHPIHKLTHMVMSDAIHLATSPSGNIQGYQVKQLFYYETYSSSVFCPDFIIDVTRVYVEARKMLSEHIFGIKTLPSLLYKFQLNHQLRGFEASCCYGEALIMDKQGAFSWSENRRIGMDMILSLYNNGT